MSINCYISNMLPSESDPGPTIGQEPMKACIPGEGMFKDLPLFKSYEWYLEALKKMQDEQQKEDGDGEGGEGSGDPLGDADSLDDHSGFGEADGTTQEIAKERMKEFLKKKAAEEELLKKKKGGY